MEMLRSTFEAWDEKQNGRFGPRPACVVFRYLDDKNRRCTQFIATCESAGRDRNKDARLIARLLNEWTKHKSEPSPNPNT